MKNIKLITFALIIFCFFFLPVFSKTLDTKKYQAIVIGKIVSSEVKKEGAFYITEYKLIPKKWLFKSSRIKESKSLIVKILGAELPEKGIIIKASTSPDYVPFNQESVFLLENTRKNSLTISKSGILSKKDFRKMKKDI